MYTTMFAVLVGVLGLEPAANAGVLSDPQLGPAPMASAQAAGGAAAAAVGGLLPARSFAQVFAAPPQPPAPSKPKQKVVCGMTILPADNGVDPKFVLAPKGRGEFPIGRMPKPKCGPETEGNKK